MHDDVDAGTRLLELLASGASAADLAALDVDPHARDLALRIAGAFDVQRRREQQLAALVDTAGELASMSDPSVVLDAIVRRARALMGTDVAYLTLYDPVNEDTYMRATAGSVSAKFQVVRLDFGAGLGGLVAQSRKPYWTADYFEDARFNHTTSIDGAVGDEGLVAICGTPLIVKDEFVGVLFASNRTPRPFTHDEVALLGSLAALAAVTIVQVRAAEESARTLAALSEATESVSRYAAGIERAAAAHDRFAEIVLEGGGVDDLTDSLTRLLGGWALLLDDEGVPRSVAGDDPPSGDALHTLAADVVERADGVRLSRLDDDVWAIGITATGEAIGYLVIGDVSTMDESDERTVERAGVVTALVLLGERNRAEARQQQRTDLVAGLVGGHGDAAVLVPAARSLGLDLREPCCLLVVRRDDGGSARSLVLAVNAALGGQALVGEVDGHVVTLIPGDEPGSLAADLATRLSRSHCVTVGAAGPVDESRATLTADLAAAHTEALRTAEALVALGRRGDGASAAELGFAGLIVGTRPEVTAYVDSVLGSLVDYDEARGTDLVGTLEAYFLAGSSPRHAATSLHVHTNTVAQRLERITRLVGEVDGHVVTLVPGDEPGSLAADLATRLSRSHCVTVGAAGPVDESRPTLTADLSAAHTEALRTAEALVALGRRGDGASAAELGFAGLIVGTRPEVTAYVDSVLGSLVDYDEARGTDLVGTLEAYFLAGSSPRHAATSLHVHTNTVAQRLERITRLVGDGWQSPDRALELQLALRLRHLVAS